MESTSRGHSLGDTRRDTRQIRNQRIEKDLFGGFLEAVMKLADARCALIFLNGSYVTEKTYPNDYDVCWSPDSVNESRLEPIFWEPRLRGQQKIRFLGEFFPSTTIVNEAGQTFVDFFQNEKITGNKKGIVKINLDTDPMLIGN